MRRDFARESFFHCFPVSRIDGRRLSSTLPAGRAFGSPESVSRVPGRPWVANGVRKDPAVRRAQPADPASSQLRRVCGLYGRARGNDDGNLEAAEAVPSLPT